ncbi:LCP family protein [Allorhizocola rhizosphaerae]|uniref:LCP family protein n=1 Tax=Allorhizocola rhizosphaerae TaxID=1872709 RepID=UPI000E3CFB01|nr:LCP family protein [Allorhizocola rhizosphaerae]
MSRSSRKRLEDTTPAKTSKSAKGPRNAKGPKSAKKQKRTRPKDPAWAKLTVILGALLMMVGGGALVTLRMASAKLDDSITTSNMIDDKSEAFAGNNIDGAINLLLVGIDVEPSYTGPGHREGVLSDTIVVMHIPKSHDQAYLLSIPRDTRVAIPAERAYGYNGSTEKINAAFGYGYRGVKADEIAKAKKLDPEVVRRSAGVDLLSKTVFRLTGIKFHGAMLIDFDGFKGVLEELGGVELCVDQRATSIHLALDKQGNIVPTWYEEAADKVHGIPPGGKRLVHEVGCRHFSPELALDYSRIRKGLDNGDYDRQKNQQKLIKAMIKKAMSKGVVTDLNRLNKVIAAGGKAMVLDHPGKKLVDFVFTLKDIRPEDLVMIRTNAGNFTSAEINGVAFETLSPESLQLFHSVRDETISQFLVSHPEFLAPE